MKNKEADKESEDFRAEDVITEKICFGPSNSNKICRQPTILY